jgi:hypothetical protein
MFTTRGAVACVWRWLRDPGRRCRGGQTRRGPAVDGWSAQSRRAT